MATVTDGDEGKEPVKDHLIATMFRMDVDRLAALRRVMSGKTRCPNCDAVNPAGQKTCGKCGAYLYPELRENEKEKSEDS
ncbi:MAG: hypothetical protein A3K67_04120 [Euryarchaeota archaeon RBG_16_62_10]|nr:MAG: hypothetical protein A3K67_04120 [Euryarchaeota archaeon RBG_16_62_10]